MLMLPDHYECLIKLLLNFQYSFNNIQYYFKTSKINIMRYSLTTTLITSTTSSP